MKQIKTHIVSLLILAICAVYTQLRRGYLTDTFVMNAFAYTAYGILVLQGIFRTQLRLKHTIPTSFALISVSITAILIQTPLIVRSSIVLYCVFLYSIYITSHIIAIVCFEYLRSYLQTYMYPYRKYIYAIIAIISTFTLAYYKQSEILNFFDGFQELGIKRSIYPPLSLLFLEFGISTGIVGVIARQLQLDQVYKSLSILILNTFLVCGTILYASTNVKNYQVLNFETCTKTPFSETVENNQKTCTLPDGRIFVEGM